MFKRMMKIALGSEVDKNYVVDENPIATGGPHFCWRVHNAKKKGTNEEVSVFMFKESFFTPEDKPYKDDFMYLLRQDVKKMMVLRHPYTLKVIEVMPENPKEIVFVTERVTCSLANMCNDFTNLPTEFIPRDIKDKNLSAFEATCGLMHLCEGLMFLHDTAKMVHLDISPENIWITPDGSWKLAGFGFSLSCEVGSTRYLLDCGTIPPMRYAAIPNMNYAAPELSTQPGNFTTAADMWSLGCLLWELFSLGQEANGTTRKLVVVEDGNPQTHAYKVQNLLPIAMDRIPQLLHPNLSSLLSTNPDKRLTAEAMKNCRYFSHGPVQTMRQLDTLLEMDEENQKEVLKDLLPALAPFPDYLLISMVLPKLAELSHISDFAPFLLPCLLYIAEKVDETTFNTKVTPAFVPMITISSPPELVTQIYEIFIGYLDMLLDKCDKTFKSKYLIPVLGRCISCGMKVLQQPVFDAIRKIVDQCEKARVKEILIPKIQKLVLEGNDVNMRVLGVQTLCDLLDIFDKTEIQSEVLNIYKKLLGSERHPVLMTTVCNCYTTIGVKFGPVVMAQTILPKITYLLSEPSLEGEQFDSMYTNVLLMLNSIKDQRQEEFRKKAEEKAKKAAEEAERAKNAPPLPTKPGDGMLDFNAPPPLPAKPTHDLMDMDAPPPLPAKPGKPMGDDMFGGMSTAPAMDMGGDMFGGMSPQPDEDVFGGMSSSNTDMFGGMSDSKPTPPPKPAKPDSDFGGDRFGGMSDSKPTPPPKPAKPEPAGDFSGMSMGGDMFGGMNESKPAADFGGISMGGDMFGGMNESKPAADFGGMSMGGDMFGGMNESKPTPPPKPAKPEPAADFGGMSMGGDMFGGMNESKPAADFSGMSMGGDMFGGMNEPNPPADFGGMSMGGDMFGGMNESKPAANFGGMNESKPSAKPEPVADFSGMSMGGDMFGGMNESKPTADFSGMSMGGDMFGGMNEPKPAADFGGMSMGGDMFGGMNESKPTPKPAKPEPAADFGGMSMGGDMFGGMNESKPTTDFGGMSMGGDMFGGMNESKPSAKSEPAADFSGMSMGGDMFGGMNESKPSTDLGGISMGNDMFSDMNNSKSNDMFGGMDSNPSSGMGGDMFSDMNSNPAPSGISGMSMGGDMFSNMF